MKNRCVWIWITTVFVSHSKFHEQSSLKDHQELEEWQLFMLFAISSKGLCLVSLSLPMTSYTILWICCQILLCAYRLVQLAAFDGSLTRPGYRLVCSQLECCDCGERRRYTHSLQHLALCDLSHHPAFCWNRKIKIIGHVLAVRLLLFESWFLTRFALMLFFINSSQIIISLSGYRVPAVTRKNSWRGFLLVRNPIFWSASASECSCGRQISWTGCCSPTWTSSLARSLWIEWSCCNLRAHTYQLLHGTEGDRGSNSSSSKPLSWYVLCKN